jgi:cyclophilin family peptidyl-prolyl cis-trans isomerase
MRILRVALPTVLIGLLLFSGAMAQEAQTPEEICATASTEDPASRTYAQAEQVLQADVDYRAILCTGAGPIYVDLLEDETPITVNNFVFLAQNGYYNNTMFHRVIANFMAQGGDPQGTGMGGPGYQFQNEPVPYLNFDAPGMLAMANAGPDTNGSQFFITTVPYPSLNQSYTLFGRVLQGQANVEGIRLRDPQTDPEPGTSLDTVVIVTDPTTVALPEPAEPATSEEVQAALDQASSIITPEVAAVLEYSTTAIATDKVIGSLSQASQESIGDLLQTHNHLYRVQGKLNNKACDLENVPLMSITYTLDAFASSDDAAAALADGIYQQLVADAGFGESHPSENLSQPYFTQAVSACDREAVSAVTFWRHGRFVAMTSIVYAADDTRTGELVDIALLQFGTGVFETYLSEVLYRDIR